MSKEVNLNSDVATTFRTARKVVGTSVAQLISIMPNAVKGIQLKAGAGNAGIVYIGRSTVTAGTAASSDGIPLAASEGLFIPIEDVTSVYAIASAISQDLYWLVI